MVKVQRYLLSTSHFIPLQKIHSPMPKIEFVKSVRELFIKNSSGHLMVPSDISFYGQLKRALEDRPTKHGLISSSGLS